MSSETASESILERARGNIDNDLLTNTGSGGLLSTGYFADAPLVDRLEDDEQPHHAVSNRRKGLRVERDEKINQITPSRNHRTAGLITDQRILFVVGQTDSDQVFEIPLTQVDAAKAKKGLLKNKLTIKCANVTYRIHTRREDDVHAVADYIESTVSKATSHGSDVDDGNGPGKTDKSGQLARAETATTTTSGISLPDTESTTTIDKDAVEYIESARGLLRDQASDTKHANLVRAHTDLCTALECIRPADGEAADQIEQVVTHIESELKGPVEKPLAIDTDNTEHGSGTPVTEQDALTADTESPETKSGDAESDTGTGDPGTIEDEPGSMEVHVQGQEGFSISGAQVTLKVDSNKTTAKTDSKGLCELSYPDSSVGQKGWLSVEHPDFEPTSGGVPVESGRVIDIQLEHESGDSHEPSAAQKPNEAPATSDRPARDDLLAELHRLNVKRSKGVSLQTMIAEGDYHPDDYRDEFGSWDAALEFADLSGEAVDGQDSTETHSTESETTQIESGVTDANRSETERKDTEAYDTTGSDLDHSDSQVSDDAKRGALLSELQELDAKWTEIDRKLLNSVSNHQPKDFENEFGSLEAALSEAGIIDDDTDSHDPKSTGHQSDESNTGTESTGTVESQDDRRGELIEELQRLDQEWSVVDRKLMFMLGDHHPDDYEEVFGSFDAALEVAGINDTDRTASQSPADNKSTTTDDTSSGTDNSVTGSRGGDTGPKYSKDDVIEEIQRMTDQLGHPPRVADFTESGRMPVSPVYRYFSGLEEAYEAAGIDDHESSGGRSGKSPDSSSTSTERPAGTTERSSASRDSSDLTPNELAELYDAFSRFQSILESAANKPDPGSDSATDRWYQTVHDYWGDSGPPDAPNYGSQQRDRNEFSINEYRDTFGNGKRVTDFHHLDLAPMDDRARNLLDESVEKHEPVVPVAPDSGTALPVIVSEDDIEQAEALLSEFPAYPEADVPHSEEDTETEPMLPEGRVDRLEVTVLEHDSNPGSRRDARLQVRTEHGSELPLDIWSTHGIAVDWQVGETYTLEQSRHKVWDSNSEQRHELSSTKDLQVTPADSDTFDDETADSGIVDTIIDDIDL